VKPSPLNALQQAGIPAEALPSASEELQRAPVAWEYLSVNAFSSLPILFLACSLPQPSTELSEHQPFYLCKVACHRQCPRCRRVSSWGSEKALSCPWRLFQLREASTAFPTRPMEFQKK